MVVSGATTSDSGWGSPRWWAPPELPPHRAREQEGRPPGCGGGGGPSLKTAQGLLLWRNRGPEACAHRRRCEPPGGGPGGRCGPMSPRAVMHLWAGNGKSLLLLPTLQTGRAAVTRCSEAAWNGQLSSPWGSVTVFRCGHPGGRGVPHAPFRHFPLLSSDQVLLHAYSERR